jgi:hypothetical protein
MGEALADLSQRARQNPAKHVASAVSPSWLQFIAAIHALLLHCLTATGSGGCCPFFGLPGHHYRVVSPVLLLLHHTCKLSPRCLTNNLLPWQHPCDCLCPGSSAGAYAQLSRVAESSRPANLTSREQIQPMSQCSADEIIHPVQLHAVQQHASMPASAEHAVRHDTPPTFVRTYRSMRMSSPSRHCSAQWNCP